MFRNFSVLRISLKEKQLEEPGPKRGAEPQSSVYSSPCLTVPLSLFSVSLSLSLSVSLCLMLSCVSLISQVLKYSSLSAPVTLLESSNERRIQILGDADMTVVVSLVK